MIIKNYELELKNRVLSLELEISNIQWDNNSIGWYEYWGAKEYDHQPDYVSEFNIDEIYIENKKVTSKIVFKILCDILYEKEGLKEEIERRAKGDIKADKYERQMEAKKEESLYS